MKSYPPSHLAAVAVAALILNGCGDAAAPGPGARDTRPGATDADTGNLLTTELPEERIEGTPIPMKVPNLRPAAGEAPRLAVPEDTALLSAGKPVTASDDLPIVGELDYVTDGDKNAGEGYYVELIDGLQWVQIDLKADYLVDAVWIWHYHSQRRAYHDVIVQVSDDAAFETGVTTLFNNDYDDSAGMGRGDDAPYIETHFGKLVDGRATTGRYVRLYQNGNTSNEMNHFTEVEVFGRPAHGPGAVAGHRVQPALNEPER